MVADDSRIAIAVSELACEQRRDSCQRAITGRLDRISNTLIDMSQAQATHIAEHRGRAQAQAEITGEHERTRSQTARVIGWIAAGLGVVGSIVGATWFLASQMQPDPVVLAQTIAKVLKP